MESRIYFDYDLQCWVKNGKVEKCGHRPEHNCGCIGWNCAGRDIAEVKNYWEQGLI
jgi:hypothetical protein